MPDHTVYSLSDKGKTEFLNTLRQSVMESEVSAIHTANVKRMIDLVDAEITETNRLLESCN